MTPPNGISNNLPSLLYRPFEVSAGISLLPGQNPQAQARLSWQPSPHFQMGIHVQSDLTHRSLLTLQVGRQTRLSESLSLEASAVGGLGLLRELPEAQGRIAERVTQNGFSWYLGGELRLNIDLLSHFGIYFNAAYLHEFNGNVTTAPARLPIAQNPSGFAGNDLLLMGGGALWRFGSASHALPSLQENRPAGPLQQQAPISPRNNPPPENSPVQAREMAAPVNTAVEQATQRLQNAQQSGIREAIENLRTNSHTLADDLRLLHTGINQNNEMLDVLNRSLDALSSTNGLNAAQRRELNLTLETLNQALTNREIPSPENMESLRRGLRYVYTSNNRSEIAGSGLANMMSVFRDRLPRHERALREALQLGYSHLSSFVTENQNRPIQITDLLVRAEGLQQSLQTIIRLGRNSRLSGTEWAQVQDDLNSTVNAVRLSMRRADALGQIHFNILGASGSFNDQSASPSRAARSFSQTLQVIRHQLGHGRFTGVTLEDLKNQYSRFFNYVANALSAFIQTHRPETLNENYRAWARAAQAGQELLRSLRPLDAMCRVLLPNPPAFPHRSTRTRPLSPNAPARSLPAPARSPARIVAPPPRDDDDTPDAT